MKKHDNHFCANNDGECICKCYSDGFEEGKNEAIKIIKKWTENKFGECKCDNRNSEKYDDHLLTAGKCQAYEHLIIYLSASKIL